MTMLIAFSVLAWCAALWVILRLSRRFDRGRPAWILLALIAAGTITGWTVKQVRRLQRSERVAQYYQAGIDERERGNLEESRRAFERVLGVSPGHPEANKRLQELATSEPVASRERAARSEVDARAPQTAAAAVPPPAPEPARGVPSREAPVASREQPGRRTSPIPHKPSPFEITQYDLEVSLDPAAHRFKATADIRIRSRGGELSQLDFSLHPECRPLEVWVNGSSAGVEHPNDVLRIRPARVIPPNGTASVRVRYERTGGRKMSQSGDLIDGKGVFLRSESRWYPATGELDFRSPVSVRATVPLPYQVVSVGNLLSKSERGGMRTYHWETERYASMVSLTAAKYETRSIVVHAPPGISRPPLPITCYTYPKHRARAAAFLKEAAAAIRFYEKLFGPYPYEKLGISEISEFPGGYGTTSFVMIAEEAFAGPRLDREFLAHEIAHQWWGNLVFPQGLGAAWLTEAFSNYSAWLFAAGRGGNARILAARIRAGTTRYFSETQKLGDQAIYETDPYQPVGASDAILYEKGAIVLHMLRREIGDRAFFRCLKRLAAERHFSTAKISDFEAIAATETGRPLTWFFDQWLNRVGGIELSYDFRTETLPNGGSELVLTVQQDNAPYECRLAIDFEAGNKAHRRSIRLRSARQEFRFESPELVTSVAVDPDGDVLQRPPRWAPGELRAAAGTPPANGVN